jgi:hypothetical protein
MASYQVTTRVLLVAVSAIMGIQFGSSANAEQRARLLAIDFDGYLYDIDSTTGAASRQRSDDYYDDYYGWRYNLYVQMTGVTAAPDGTLFAFGVDLFADAETREMYNMNANTGEVLYVRPIGGEEPGRTVEWCVVLSKSF